MTGLYSEQKRGPCSQEIDIFNLRGLKLSVSRRLAQQFTVIVSKLCNSFRVFSII